MEKVIMPEVGAFHLSKIYLEIFSSFNWESIFIILGDIFVTIYFKDH